MDAIKSPKTKPPKAPSIRSKTFKAPQKFGGPKAPKKPKSHKAPKKLKRPKASNKLKEPHNSNSSYDPSLDPSNKASNSPYTFPSVELSKDTNSAPSYVTSVDQIQFSS